MVEYGISSYYHVSWRCFSCRKQVFVLKSADCHGDCVSWGQGRFLCLPCKETVNERNRTERAAKKQRDEDHWQDIGDLDLAEDN